MSLFTLFIYFHWSLDLIKKKNMYLKFCTCTKQTRQNLISTRWRTRVTLMAQVTCFVIKISEGIIYHWYIHTKISIKIFIEYLLLRRLFRCNDPERATLKLGHWLLWLFLKNLTLVMIICKLNTEQINYRIHVKKRFARICKRFIHFDWIIYYKI